MKGKGELPHKALRINDCTKNLLMVAERDVKEVKRDKPITQKCSVVSVLVVNGLKEFEFH